MSTPLDVARSLRAIAKKMGADNGFAHDLRLLAHKLESGEAPAPEAQPPCDNAHVAPGCEPFPDEVLQVNNLPADVLTGGNHLASVLIAWLGPDFPYRFPPTLDPESARTKMAKEAGSNAFDVWCGWAAIMRGRNEFVAGTKQGETP